MTELTNPASVIEDPAARVSTECLLRPRFEGVNICTWIGFKHVNYLVEEALLDHLRQLGLSSRSLFEEFGVGVDIIDIDTRILHALHVDDETVAQVTTTVADGAISARVVLLVPGQGAPRKAVTAKVTAVLRRDTRHSGDVRPLPARWAAAVVDEIGANEVITAVTDVELAGAGGRGQVTQQIDDRLLIGNGPAVLWHWRIPYFYCHHTVRLQMSGLLRQMEEVVDLFLAERGASIRTLLDDQDWIPVVPHSRIRMVGEALMEEELITVFQVESVFKTSTYTSRMDCYARRGNDLVLVATGVITHGYAVIQGRTDWTLVEFDERLLRAVGVTG
jgi:hypothetical protein